MFLLKKQDHDHGNRSHNITQKSQEHTRNMNISEEDRGRQTAPDYPVDAPDQDYKEKEKIGTTCF
jgi:hypothetical protein